MAQGRKVERFEALQRLRRCEPELRRVGVRQLYMFGSTANGKARPDSDVDMFFDHDKGTIGLIELDAITRITARALGKEVDIMTRDSLHPALRRQIETAALRVF